MHTSSRFSIRSDAVSDISGFISALHTIHCQLLAGSTGSSRHKFKSVFNDFTGISVEMCTIVVPFVFGMHFSRRLSSSISWVRRSSRSNSTGIFEYFEQKTRELSISGVNITTSLNDGLERSRSEISNASVYCSCMYNCSCSWSKVCFRRIQDVKMYFLLFQLFSGR